MSVLGVLRDRVLPGVAVAGLAALVLASGVLEPVRRDVADWLVRAAAARPPAAPTGMPDVTVVAIDPQSLRALPPWPWPRGVYADLVDRLDAAGARAIGFDIDFSTPRDPEQDASFARAMQRSGRVALATFRQLQQLPGGAELEVATLAIPLLADAAAAHGSVLMPVDPDGIVRRFPRRSRIGERSMPSLAEAALDIALRGASVPGGAPVFAPVDYRRARPDVPIVSIADVLEGRFDPSHIAGRVVLVGATAAEFQDLWSTPSGPAQPGVLIQALTLRTLAAERAGAPVLAFPGRPVELGFGLALSLLAGGLAGLGHLRRTLALAGLALALPCASFAALRASGWLLDPVLPLGILAGHHLLGLETVRRRFGRRLAARDHSLTTLSQVGQATSTGASGLDLALTLLGDVVSATAVAFLRASAGGALDGGRLEWRRSPGPAVGDLAQAARILASGRLELFRGGIPGAPERPGVAAYLPLFAGRTPVGVLVVEREGAAGFEDAELRTIETVGAQLALSAENLRLIDDLRSSFETSVAAIASAIEARDGYTESHCRRLAAFSVAVGQRLDLSFEDLESIRLGALLHDVGKIGIRDEILLKPTRFTPEERRSMEQHTIIGVDIVAPIHGISELTIACVRHHHERWDGGGYPDGLAGSDIPLAARVVSVVDVWDALSTARPYKPALPQDKVREILEKGRGEQFDPDVLDVFLRVLDEEGEEMLDLVDRSMRSLA